MPVLEAALAANGYHIEVPMQKSAGGAAAMVMQCGAASLLFTHTPNSAVIELEVGGVAQVAAVQFLESLPIPLARQLATPLSQRE
jgi:hypothetical protein